MFQSIGFIGTGNMGSALARAADKGAPQGAVLHQMCIRDRWRTA